MTDLKEYPFIFSPKYRLLRHATFWAVHIVVYSFLYRVPDQSYFTQHVGSAIWVIAFMAYVYPILFVFIPNLLLKEKLLQFAIVLLLWGVGGYFFNYLFRKHVFFPLGEIAGIKYDRKNPWAPSGFFGMNLMAGYASMIVLFKYWMVKQRDFLFEQKEKMNAELQLLKAQIHPHFLFNTLNNIYSFALKASPKTPEMVIKLSSLLSYMLYECKANEVLLEKEIAIMKNYIDLEKERYANKLEISVNIEGDTKDKYIAPLLLLPFLENAFKHGTSEQLEKPWLSIDLSVKQQVMRCKIVNSKNETKMPNEEGIGIRNVKKRLAYLYPGKHELKLSDEETFFVVSVMLELKQHSALEQTEKAASITLTEN